MSQRIPIVEDQEDYRKILRDMPTNAGFALLEATAAGERVTLAETERPDLILMDIQLPDLDGYEATRRIKATPSLQHIPLIALTSYALRGE